MRVLSAGDAADAVVVLPALCRMQLMWVMDMDKEENDWAEDGDSEHDGTGDWSDGL